MADYKISAILSLKDQLTGKLKGVSSAIKSLGSATKNVERGMGSVSKGIGGVNKGIGDFKNQDLKVRLGVEGLERVERLKGAIEAARAGKAINIRANDEATSRLQRIKSELQSLVSKPWTALVNIKDNAKAALGKMKTGVGEMVGGAAMGMGATMLGTAGIGYGAVNAVQSQADFEKSMSSVKAVLSGAYKGAELESVMTSLTAKAEKMGATTKFTAKEAAEGLYYMGMAGWKAEQMTAGLPPILNLAAAGNTDLATTSDIVTDSMTGFGLKAGQYVRNAKGELVESTAHYADLMAALVTNANTDIPMLGETLKYAAPLVGAMYSNQDEHARMTGAQDMMLVAGLMANAGIKSSQAGTSARALFSRLGSQNRNADFARQFLNVDFKDAETGEVRRMKDFFGDLRTKFQKGMDVNDLLDFAEDLEGTKLHADTRRKLESSLKSAQEHGGKMTGSEMLKMAAMLSGQEAMSGLLAVMTASEEDWNKLSEALDNAEGAAERMSEIQLDNLAGDITIMGSAWDAFQRNLVKGDASKGLRAFTQSLTDTLSKANELFKDGIDIGDFGTIIIDVIAKLKAKFLELDGIGSILAGGTLIFGLKKVLSMALSVKDTLSAWAKVRNAGDVGGLIRGSKGAAGTGGLSSVGAMNVRAGSVSIRAAVVNVSGAVKGLPSGGAGGRGAVISANQQRVNEYYARRQQILNPTRPVPPVVPPAATPPPAGAANVLKSGLKMVGGAGILSAVFGALDVVATRSNGEYMLSTAQADLELARAELKTLREQEAGVSQINGQIEKIRQAEEYVKQVRQTNSENERRSLSGATGMVAGSIAGAAIGSAVPVIGTTIGAIIGGILGQMAGEKAADNFIENERARREEETGAGIGEASMGEFRRVQDTGYQKTGARATSEYALEKYGGSMSKRQTADYEESRRSREFAVRYEQADAVERGQMDWQRFKHLEDETYKTRRIAQESRQSEAEEIQRQYDTAKRQREVFANVAQTEEIGGTRRYTGAKVLTRQQAAGYTSLNGLDTGTTGLENFGVMKTAEQVKSEVEERNRLTNLLNEFDVGGERREAIEAARENQGSLVERLRKMSGTDTAPREKPEEPINWAEENAKVNEPFKAREWKGIGSDFDASKIAPMSPYAGLGQYGGQKAGLETGGVANIDTSKINPVNPYASLTQTGTTQTGLENRNVATGVQTSASEQVSSAFKNLDFSKASEIAKGTVLEQIGAMFDPLSAILGTSRAQASTAEASAAAPTTDLPNLSDFKLPEINLGEKISSELESASSKIDNFKGTASEKFSRFGETASNGLESASAAFDNFKNAASTSFDEVTATIGEKFSSVSDSVTSGITETGASISEGFSGAFESVSTSISTQLETFVTGFEGVQSSAAAFVEGLTTTLSTGFETVVTGVTSAFEAISMTASTGFEMLQMTVASALESVSMTFSTTFETILASTSAVLESVVGAISAGVETAHAAISSAFTAAAAEVQGIWGAIPGFFSGVFGSLGGIASAAGSAIASGINSGIGMIQSAWEALSGWLSAKISSLATMAASAAASIGIGGNASGTSSWRGGFTTVNEHGGELIILPSGEKIYPQATTNSAIGDVAHNYSGTSFFEGNGWSEVNGTGSELMYLPRGTRIIPHATTVGILRKQIREKLEEQNRGVLQQSTRGNTSAVAVALGNGLQNAGGEEVAGTGSKKALARDMLGSDEWSNTPDNNTAPAITQYRRNKELFSNATSRLFSTDSLGNLRGVEIPEYNRITSEDSISVRRAKREAQIRAMNVAHNYSGTSYFEAAAKKQLIETDALGNLKGVEVAEYNRITADDSVSVRRAKFEAQRRAYFEQWASAEHISDKLGNIVGLNGLSDNVINVEDSRAVQKAKRLAQIREYRAKIAHNYGGATNFEGGLSTVNEHGGEIIQLPNGATIYPKATVEREIKTDRLGNIRGLEVPSYNRISGGDSLTVQKAKYAAQLKQYRAGKNVEVQTGTIRATGGEKTGGGKNFFEKGTEAANDFFFKLFHPRKYAAKKANSPEFKTVTTSVGEPSPIQRVTNSINDFFFKLFHPRKYAATINAASETSLVDTDSTTSRGDIFSSVNWGGLLTAISNKDSQQRVLGIAQALMGGGNSNLSSASFNFGYKKPRISSTNISFNSEYVEKRRAGHANWIANLQQLNPNAPVRTLGMADDMLNPVLPNPLNVRTQSAGLPTSSSNTGSSNPLGIRIQSAGLPTSGSNADGQDVFGSISDYFFKIFHPRKYAAKKAGKTAPLDTNIKLENGRGNAFESINNYFYKIFHPRKYALKKRGSDKLGNINGLNGLADNVITENDSLTVQKAKREAQIRAFKSQNTKHTGRRKNFFEKTWEAIVGFFGGGKKKADAELKPIVNAAPAEKINPTVAEPVKDAKKSADFFQKELPSQARSLDPNRKTQAEILYAELSEKYAQLEKIRNTSKPVTAASTVNTQTRDLSSASMTIEQLQELRRENVLKQVAERNATIGGENLREMRETGYDAATYNTVASAENLAAYRARIEANARDSEALAKIRRETVRKQLAERKIEVSEESMQAVRELNAAAVARAANGNSASDSPKLAENRRATLEKNRRDSEALAKRLAEREITVSAESQQSVRELNEAAVQRARTGIEGAASITTLKKNRRDSETLAKIRRETVRKQLAERKIEVSEESMQAVRELNAAAVARESRATFDSSTQDIRRTAALENLREIQRLREAGDLNADNSLMAGNFFSTAGQGSLDELPVPKFTVPTVDGGTTNSTSNSTSNTSSANFNFGDVNINNGADFEEFMHRLKTLFAQSAVNYAGA